MKYFLLCSFCILLMLESISQDSVKSSPSGWQAGIELDVLPYLTGGYFGAGWVGKNKWRLRALTAFVKKPDWAVSSDFSNHQITAYALVADHFFQPGWKGFWLGGGPVFWKSAIQTDLQKETAESNNWLLNGSAGYHFILGKHLYLSPWVGLSLRIAGDEAVPVDNTTFTLPLLNPEASLKVGISF